ncbi:hypothetical protein [Novipirellula artificiosorum]|uniref:Uncharacterized protein n=1 Tax=Novipirellula artificiosorum TaxID=2528016 RepID=A0A5C6DQ57_9BACT|nr:hypothetical protein [Novipirellula artificiosorum]TWU38304.1 hypothetical protein Poly41_27800 [Novipirellula artificiosorum]
MPEPEKKRWLAIPKDWVVNAAPIAGICILLGFGFFPIAFSLLHVWLWLRHPRSRSRYLIAAIPIGIVVLILCFMIFLSYLDSLSMGGPVLQVHMKEDALQLVGAIAAGGLIPILYRLFSRNSLAYVGESDPGDRSGPSRGSIADMLFLSAFFALTLVTLQSVDVDTDRMFNYWGQATDPVAMAIAGSVAGIVSMRLISRSSGRAVVGRFALAFFSSLLLIYAVLELNLFVRWWSMDIGGSFKFSWQDKYYWENDQTALFLSAVSIPVFAVLMRCCGVVLRRDVVSSRFPVPETPTAEKATRRITRGAMQVVGTLFIAFIVGAVCFWPGKLGAGIPWTYLQRIEVDSDVYETISLSWPALIADAAVGIMVTIAFVISVPRDSHRRIRRAKFTILIVFLLLLIYACYLYPLRHSGIQKEKGILSLRREEVFDSALESLLYKVEEFFGLNEWIKRGEIYAIRLREANDDELRQAFTLPRLRRLHLESCVVSESVLQDLAASETLEAVKVEKCQLPEEAGDIIRNLPRLNYMSVDLLTLKSLNIQSFNLPQRVDLDIYTDGTEIIKIPVGVGNVWVYVPMDHEGEVLFDHAGNATKIRVQRNEYLINFF